MFKPYTYIKETSSEPRERKGFWELNLHLEGPDINWRWAISTVFIFSGLFLVVSQILVPWLTTSPTQKPLLKPTTSTVLGVDKIPLERNFVTVEFEFAELKQEERQEGAGATLIFYLTVPKLGIKKAEVEVNSQNLSPDERLGHYPGSALPGEVGNTFIYGHSASPMFFDPQNYRTILSTLYKLEKGDGIIVEFGGKYFKYVVEKSIVLNPEDVEPLEPIAPAFLRQSYLTLMTCVPPGIRTKRLLVQARLVL